MSRIAPKLQVNLADGHTQEKELDATTLSNHRAVMLDAIRIRNYRSCVDTSIILQPDLSVLIGPNGSGKTNILSAMLLLRLLADPRSGRRYLNSVEGQLADECSVKARFRLGKKHATLNARLQLCTDETNTDVLTDATQKWDTHEFTSLKKQFEIPLWAVQDEIYSPVYLRSIRSRSGKIMISHAAENDELKLFRRPFFKIAEFSSKIKYYTASQFTNPSQCPASFAIEKSESSSRGLRLQGHTKFLNDLYMHYSFSKKSYDRYLNVIGPQGIGLVDKITFKEIRTSSVDYKVSSAESIGKRKRERLLVVPQFKIGRNVLSPSQLSEGTFKTITLLFYLMTEESSALLIEEPEVCVHHGLLSSIVELIKTYSRKKQIILSTHSDFILDYIGERHVYKINRDKVSGTKVSQISKSMSAADLKALHHYLATEGNLGEYWRHGGLD